MSDKLFRTLTIGGVTYTLNDTTKLEKPTNNGTTGQILVKTDEGSMWQNSSTDTISYNDLTDKPTINGVELSGDITINTGGTAPDGDFVTQDEFDTAIGDINSILDEINGEEV